MSEKGGKYISGDRYVDANGKDLGAVDAPKPAKAAPKKSKAKAS